jgi:hypothetical protein
LKAGKLKGSDDIITAPFFGVESQGQRKAELEVLSYELLRSDYRESVKKEKVKHVRN